MQEAPKFFGITVAKEIVFVIYQILKHKIKEFHALIKAKKSIIPKLHCLYDWRSDILNEVAKDNELQEK